LGLGGLFIRTKEPLAIGTIIKLLIDIPGGGVRGRAIVRNIKAGQGMGVVIVSMGPEDRMRFNSFLSHLRARGELSKQERAGGGQGPPPPD
jgi:hypothetical protein